MHSSGGGGGERLPCIIRYAMSDYIFTSDSFMFNITLCEAALDSQSWGPRFESICYVGYTLWQATLSAGHGLTICAPWALVMGVNRGDTVPHDFSRGGGDIISNVPPRCWGCMIIHWNEDLFSREVSAGAVWPFFLLLLVREVGDVRWVPLLCVWKIDPKMLRSGKKSVGVRHPPPPPPPPMVWFGLTPRPLVALIYSAQAVCFLLVAK